MCEPMTIAAVIGAGISVASTAVGTALSIDAAQKQAAAIEQDAARNAKIAQHNAGLARLQRADILQRGELEAGRVSKLGQRFASAGRAAAAKSGVQTDSGSMANLLNRSEINAEIDADRIRAAAARQAWGYEAEDIDWLEKAKGQRALAGRARNAGILGSVATGLSGTSAGANTLIGTGMSLSKMT